MLFKYSFEKLEVCQDAKVLVLLIYSVTKNFPASEKFSLCNQMQRCSISIVSNIAEGTSRNSIPEKQRFLEIAYSSALELYCQVIISEELLYINNETVLELKQQINKVTNKLNALSKSYIKSK